MTLQEIAKLINGTLAKTFDYEVSKDKQFLTVETPNALSVEMMKVLYDNGMRVNYELYASAEKGRYTLYVINHKRTADYEWVD